MHWGAVATLHPSAESWRNSIDYEKIASTERHIMPDLTVMPRKTSPQVFLLLGRAVPIVDQLFRELGSAGEMVALIDALSDHLEGRREALELARTPPASPRGA